MTPAEDGVISHVQRFFEGQDVSVVFPPGGPVLKRVPNFRVLQIAPGPRLPGLWTYISVGCWDAVHTDKGHGVEFVMTASERSERHLLHLAMAAYYHAGPNEQRLDLGHTIPIGEGWTEGSHLDHFLVSLPYPLGSDLERCEWEGGHARLLWLLPITQAERDFKATHGADALEERFDAAAIRFWEPDRPSVVYVPVARQIASPVRYGARRPTSTESAIGVCFKASILSPNSQRGKTRWLMSSSCWR